jgi:hypothetical protein
MAVLVLYILVAYFAMFYIPHFGSNDSQHHGRRGSLSRD